MYRLRFRASRPMRQLMAALSLAAALVMLPVVTVAFSAPVPQEIATPEPPLAPTATPSGSASTTQNIFHILSFPFETMTEAVVQMSNKLVLASFEAAGQHFSGALEALISGPLGIVPAGAESQLFAAIIWPHWQVTFTLTLMLLPVTLMLVAVSALRYGAVSQLGWLDLKEAVGNWFISVGAAATSFYLLSLAHRLGLSAALAVLQADFGERVTGSTLAGAFFNATALMALASNALTSPVVLYLAFLALFLASTVLMGLGLALAAYLALVYLLSVIAPLVIVLGVLPPVRWLNALWLKSICVVFLLPLADALLLKAAISLALNLVNASGAGEMGGFVAGLFVTAGVISVLITINYKVAEGIFGALAEVQRQTQETAMGVLRLVAVASGYMLGGGAVSAPLGLATASGTGAGVAQPTPVSTSAPQPSPAERGFPDWAERSQAWAGRMGGVSAEASVGPEPNASNNAPARDDAHISPGHSQEASPARSRLANYVGQALSASTNHPVLRGLGVGLQLGNAVAEAQSESTRLPAVEPPSQVEPAASWTPPAEAVKSQPHWPDDTDLLARDLRRTFAARDQQMAPADAVTLTQATYGAWRQQGFKGGAATQRAIAETLTNPQQTASAQSFVTAFETLAQRHHFKLDEAFARQVQMIYGRATTAPEPRRGTPPSA